jgi:hypothetical protein
VSIRQAIEQARVRAIREQLAALELAEREGARP